MSMKPFSRSKAARNHRGFTMIELMIVVVMIGILSAMAVPTFVRTIPRLKARAEARNMLNFIRTARSRAIAENTPYGVYFDVTARQYLLFRDIANLSQMRYESGDSIVTGPITLDPNVVYGVASFTNNSIVLLPTGAASQTGSVSINTVRNDAPYSVSILAATGKSKLQ